MDKFLVPSPSLPKAIGHRTSSPKYKIFAKGPSHKKRIGATALKDHNKTSKNVCKEAKSKSFKIYEDCKEDKPDDEPSTKADLVDEECQTECSACFCSCHASEKNIAELSLDLGSSIAIDPEEEANRKKIQEEVPDDYWYWVGLAHNKSEALNETMEEAMQLADEVDKLKGENAHLSKVAEYSYYFASVLESLIDDSKEDSGIAELSKCLAKYKDLRQDHLSPLGDEKEETDRTADGEKETNRIAVEEKEKETTVEGNAEAEHVKSR